MVATAGPRCSTITCRFRRHSIVIPVLIHRLQRSAWQTNRHLRMGKDFGHRALLVVRNRPQGEMPPAGDVVTAFRGARELNRDEIAQLLNEPGWQIGPAPGGAVATD